METAETSKMNNKMDNKMDMSQIKIDMSQTVLDMSQIVSNRFMNYIPDLP